MARENYLRAGKAIDQRLTARALNAIADWLDLADNGSRTSVYPTAGLTGDPEDLCYAWCWAALLVANAEDTPTATLRALATSIASIYEDSDV